MTLILENEIFGHFQPDAIDPFHMEACSPTWDSTNHIWTWEAQLGHGGMHMQTTTIETET